MKRIVVASLLAVSVTGLAKRMKLIDRKRQVYYLGIIKDKPPKEISEQLGISEKYVKQLETLIYGRDKTDQNKKPRSCCSPESRAAFRKVLQTNRELWGGKFPWFPPND